MGAPHPPSPVLWPSKPLPSPGLILPPRCDPAHPSPPCLLAPSLPLAPGSCAPSPACSSAPVSCPSLCRPRPCLSRASALLCCRLCPCPSRAPARVPCRALCPELHHPCPCVSRASPLPRCCLGWCPPRAPVALCRYERPGPSPVCALSRCCLRLCPALVPALLPRCLPPSLGRRPSLALRLHRLHPALLERRALLLGPRVAEAEAASCPSACAGASERERAAASPQGRRPWADTVWWGSRVCGWAACGRGTLRPPCPPLRSPERHPRPEQGLSRAQVARQEPRRG